MDDPFVENAVKHNPKSGSRVYLSFRIADGRLRFECANHKARKPRAGAQGGIELANIRRRLDLLFGNGYSLALIDENELYTVIMEI